MFVRGMLSLIAVVLFGSHIAAAGTRTYVGLYGRCDAGAAAARISTGGNMILYPFTGERKGRHFIACVDGNNGWYDKPGAPDGCQYFDIASYQVTCYGGTLSAAQFYAGFAQDMKYNKLHLNGQTLAAEVRPSVMVVPFDNNLDRTIVASTRLSPLAAGYAPFPSGLRFQEFEWDETADAPATSGDANVAVPANYEPPPTPQWVLALSHPYVAVSLFLLLVVYIAIAAFGFFTSSGGPVRFTLASIAALGMLFLAISTAGSPDPAFEKANAFLARARSDLHGMESKNAELHRIVHGGTSALVPLDQAAVQQIRNLKQRGSIYLPKPPVPELTLWVVIYLLGPGLFMALYVMRFVAGYYHLFRKPPIVDIVGSSLNSGRPVDMKAAARALQPNPSEARDPPPAYQSDSQAIHMDALTARLSSEKVPKVHSQSSSGDRHRSYLNKLRAAGLLMKTLVTRHIKQHEQQTLPDPVAHQEEEDYKRRLADAIRRREKADREYEDEQREFLRNPRDGSQ